jgi:hypothetical protein
MHGTWFHPLCNQLHQCDHIFLRWKDRHVVREVWGAAMLTNTDHCSVRADLFLKKWKKPTATLRKIRIDKDFSRLFNPSTISSTSAETRAAMTRAPTNVTDPTTKTTQDTTNEMCSLLAAVDKTISALPKIENQPRGWHDVNDPTTRPLLMARNRDHGRWIAAGTTTSKATCRASDKKLQLAFRQAEDKWWQAELAPAHNPSLPGGSARRSPRACWKQAQHALRGSSKWKPRQRAFTRNAVGVQASTVATSVANVCDCFSGTYNFDTRPQAAAHIARVQQTEPDRSSPPRTHEVLAAVRALKHKAPGPSGAPICASFSDRAGICPTPTTSSSPISNPRTPFRT